VRLPFELDSQIIHHIIYSQAGSIGKSLLELLMNSADAGGSRAALFISKTGFDCSDDGQGFATRDDVLRYFGRFGTPHQDGDATYGRFRLGRGQIMAHASTDWRSNEWRMQVDVRAMGYSYELDVMPAPVVGCSITGQWYEPLAEVELQSCLQEIRDLVRYTPISVELNGRVISRDPAGEKWDHEDEHAYYRVREEGAVSIYNQGVLVRHDPGGQWGAGGLIVSKKAIDLNVSRTEILRKTCPVWRPIAKQFAGLAEAFNTRLGDHRKTEARREQSAKALLSGDAKGWDLFANEEVVTVLPGRRHVTLQQVLDSTRRTGGNITVVERAEDVPRGEAIAKEGIAVVLHSKTLDRFGCYNVLDFKDALERIFTHLRGEAQRNPGNSSWRQECARKLKVPNFVAFSVLKESFLERTRVVMEADALDKETRRAWVALRWCLREYADACLGGKRRRGGRYTRARRDPMHILIGESNVADAWTDARTYIAINIEHVRRLKAEPLLAVSHIFSLAEHEIAHDGDSLDCGHDEAFFQRYHDISLGMAAERQRFIHMWLMKYTRSLENEGKKASGSAWFERMLVDRAGSGRQKRDLSPAMPDLSNEPLVNEAVPTESIAFISKVNVGLIAAGVCPRPSEWEEVLARARKAQMTMDDAILRWRLESDEAERAMAQDAAERRAPLDVERARIAGSLCIPIERVLYEHTEYLWGLTGAGLQTAWDSIPVEEDVMVCEDGLFDDRQPHEAEQERRQELPARDSIDPELRELVYEGETLWTLTRNAAAAGFSFLPNYLRWRKQCADA